ncbi:hypothetical protein [uncultured Aliiroseovarius sp.]|uniref:hypothetical protein n=1 Tax=uncultured Aliiroseovarius sp. TaxID=1658783 RepID=UPI00261C7E8E|nr:hypothetical protein [uncultured Aliiroseovarius sp.]
MRTYILGLLLMAGPVWAHDAVIDGATARASGAGWSISVTLTHEEAGWDDYADGWRVETEAGEVLGTRVLAHPHVNEQPFTRSLSGVDVPEGVTTVWIRARTSADGWGQERFRLDLP